MLVQRGSKSPELDVNVISQDYGMGVAMYILDVDFQGCGGG